jgi:hypothetical protein
MEGIDHALDRDSSKRPAEQGDVEPRMSGGHSLDGSDAKLDLLSCAALLAAARSVDVQSLRINRYHRGSERRVLDREPPIAAANFENPLAL